MNKFSSLVAFLINTFLLTLVYFSGVFLTSIIMKISGRRFLELEQKEIVNSYWRNIGHDNVGSDYYRRF